MTPEQQAQANRDREAARKEATRRKWQSHERRWNKLYGRPIKEKA